MTVTSTTSKSGPYNLNGVTTTFPRMFRIGPASDLKVIRIQDGVETVLTTGFTVTGTYENTGNVIFSPALNGGELVLLRALPITQETDYSDQAKVAPSQVEADLDKVVRLIQDMDERLDRAAVLPVNADPAETAYLVRNIQRLGDSADNIDIVANNIDLMEGVVAISNAIETVAGLSDEILDIPGQIDDIEGLVAQAKAAAAIAAASVVAIRTPAHWGAVCDGITDDTNAIRALHDFCNAAGIDPDYSGVGHVVIQANADIKINTSVDFCGARLSLLNGFVDTPAWAAPFNRAFHVYDEARPIVAVGPAIAVPDPSKFVVGSFEACVGLMPGAGWFWTQLNGGAAPTISNRDSNGSRAWRCAHRVDEHLRTQHPLPVDLSGADTIFYMHRLNSDRPITVGGLVIDASKFNQQHVFLVERNQVTVSDIRVLYVGARPANTVNIIIHPYRCSDFTLRRVIGTGCDTTEDEGTYVVSINDVANYLVEDCTVRSDYAQGGWSWCATHFCNGGIFSRCDVDRLDVHEYSLNLTVDGCTLYTRGLGIGHGGGTLRVSNTKYYQQRTGYAFIHGRPDYGKGSWNGDWIIENVVHVGGVFGGTLVDFETYPIGGTGPVASLPNVISISNVDYVRYGPATDIQEYCPLAIKVNLATTGGVTPPSSIKISGVSSATRWRMCNIIDLASCKEALRGADRGVTISISDCDPTEGSATRRTLGIPADTGPGYSNLFRISITDVHNAALDLSGISYAGSWLQIKGGVVRRAVIPTAVSVAYDGVFFFDPLLVGSETVAPLGHSTVFGSRFASISGGRVSGAFDLSQFHAINGLASTTASIAGATLPGGVTRTMLFDGWMSA